GAGVGRSIGRHRQPLRHDCQHLSAGIAADNANRQECRRCGRYCDADWRSGLGGRRLLRLDPLRTDPYSAIMSRFAGIGSPDEHAMTMLMPPTAPPPGPPHRFDPFAAVLSYLVPGLGQIVQGRIGKGFLFLLSIYSLFFYGMFLGKWSNVFLA